MHHGTGKGFLAAAQLNDVAARGDELQAGHGGGQVLVGRAGAVGAGGAGAGHRDVRQRGQVAQRETGPVQAAGHVGVAEAGRDPDLRGGRVDVHLGRQAGQADLGAG